MSASFVTIPFCRDSDFVNRGDILEQIHQRCSEPASRVALVGLGGVGKSQLAIEFAHRIAAGPADTWVFWVHAGTQARVEEGFTAIAHAVKLAGRNQPKANIPQLVYGWLSNEGNGRWMIILDSADDRDVFYGVSSDREGQPLAKYLPQSRNGSIIVTTRDKDLAFRLTGNHRNIIEVGPMSQADALTLLQKKLRQLSETDAAANLVQALDYIPLAISQAAAYIQARAPRSSVEEYLAKFREGERKKARLLGYDAGDLRRDGGASNAILTTWQISFDHIRSKRPTAADLLSLMSFFDRQGILESLLKPPKADDDDVAILRYFCLVTISEVGDGFEMHGLVQLSTRKWLEASGQQEKFKQQFVARMAASFPTGAYGNWATCQRLFAHVEAAAEYRPVEGEVEEAWATLLYNGAWYAWLQGRYDVAERMARKAMRTHEKRLGREDKRTLDSMSLFASVLRDKGIWKEAEKLEAQVMETRKMKLGADHPDTLTSMANLASTLWNQGRWDEAEKLEVQVMETRKTKLGADHPSTLTSMANLASTYRNQGRWDEAEKLFVQVMETSKTKLGADHPDTLTSMNNLAFTWRGQGRHIDALALMKECAQTRQRVLGPEHPHTLSSLAAVGQWRS
ncbi:P-loop containing nucleoside triphosphate hydrolase protein [Diplogelasinospora grovesii]|uniref:P-loop containing nucleoside triphosphate hydrolase protein n=1 Tax=Diplogelasinospora grovesii TaxID=303347 RepID=A0AAN6S3I9_9PEZI|nr:P-loop containing nucleoside triphosphate hydrolase protein [Diplogelasinospora grovesii]